MHPEKRVPSQQTFFYHTLIDPLIRPLRPRIAGMCRDLGAKRVLDIASGTGAQCRTLASHGIEAVGLDLSKEMVDFANQRSERSSSYFHGSALDLPFRDDAFDTCTLVLALHEHSENERQRMLAEALRVASQYVVIADYEIPPHPAINLAWQMIRSIEALAGSSHHEGFRHFVAQGALTGFLARHHLASQAARPSHFATLRAVAIKAVRPDRT